MRYIKKPVIIDAVQWLGDNWIQMDKFITQDHRTYPSYGEIVILTLEGEMIARVGDWIIKGVQGEFYPCKPEIFEMTYEPYFESPFSND